MGRARAFFSSVVVSLVLACPASAAVTRLVDDDAVQCPSASFHSIQAAVGAAGPGDTVLVCDGRYREQVTIGAGKDGLRLRAKRLRHAIIQAPAVVSGFPTIVRITGGVSGVEVSGFVIQNGPSPSALTGVDVDGGATARSIRLNLIRRLNAVGIEVLNDPNRPGGAGRALDIAFNAIQEYGGAGGGFGVLVSGAGASGAMSFNRLIGQPHTTGISIQSQATGRAVGNWISGNQVDGSGIFLSQLTSTGVLVRGNLVTDNGFGIDLFDVHGALVRANRSTGNDRQGLLLDSLSTGNRLDQNDARSNDGTDCEDRSSGAGTAGTANTWTADRGIESSPNGICTP
jgi:nitrous oxidase accessory protein NosD